MIGRFITRPLKPREKVDVHDFGGVVRAAFPTGTPVVAGKPVIETLTRLYNYVSQNVVPALERFL